VDNPKGGQDLSGQRAALMKTVLYCRVSTLDQTLAHQRTQAQAAGFQIDEVVADHGVSGVHTALRERPEGRRLFDMLRAGDTLVVRWVDRLGRNYADVTDTIREFIRRGVIVRTVINGLTFDGATKDAMQQAVRDSLIAFMAATAQAQAEIIKEAQKAGIAHAQAHDDGTKYRGRKPTFSWQQFMLVRELLNQGIAISAIAKTTGLKRQSIYRIHARPEQQLAALAAWYPESAKENFR
jgi:putative DNA-invertase from lambdoid prophage Rac